MQIRGNGTMPPLWPCNKVLKPNFQSIISRTNNDCSFLSLILAKLLFLDISCENIFALSVVTAHTACPFSTKKCAKMSVFLCENLKNSLKARSFPPRPPVAPPPLPNPGCAPPLLENFCVRHWLQLLLV